MFALDAKTMQKIAPVVRRVLPGLTTIQQPLADICATAVRLLVEQIGAEPPADPTPVPAIELPVRVVEGRTA